MTTKYDAVIIGAGLTGLTVGYYLNKAGKNILILEQSSRSGGVIQSHNEDGFVYESGPNSGVLSSYESFKLFDDLKDKCELEVANDASNARWILKDNKIEPLPSGIIPGIKTPLFTFGDKLNILIEPFKPKGSNPDESVADLVRRRLGSSFLNYAVDPFISGIYAGNPEKLITKYALPKLYNLEQNYGSFIKGAIKKGFEKKSEEDKKANKRIFSFKNGLGSLVSALDSELNSNIRLNAKDIKIDDKNHHIVNFRINDEQFVVEADFVITTIGSYSLENILPPDIKKMGKAIFRLNYAKVVQVIAGYKNWTGQPLNAFGLLIPAIEKRNTLGILFTSSIFKNRAPENGALLSVFMGGAKKPEFFDKSEDEIKSIALNEISEILKPKNISPDLLKIFKYPYAIPQYEISSKGRFEQIDQIQDKYKSLILAGNIRNGIGMSDRITQGVNIAKDIVK